MELTHSHPPAEETPSEWQSADNQPDLFEFQQAGASVRRRMIKLEVNLMRLPLFALQTKGLRSLDGIECRGSITRNGETHRFVFTATRNTATLYPGPLARKAHLAFLSLITDNGLPVENPIPFSWRDLCKRMGVSYSGKMIENLKAAVESTRFLGIKSHYAIWSKAEARLLRTQEDALSLYDRVSFVGGELPGGEKADTNYLWLSGWYLDNLNAMYTAPLHYELWRWLDDQSPIASRLYEFLLLNFYSGTPVLKINYETLAQFLPVKPEPYRSQAKQQFDPAFKLLTAMEVIERVSWADSKSGIAQINIYRGKNLTPPRERGLLSMGFFDEDFAGAIEVKELRNLKPADWMLVCEFYRLWEAKDDARPTAKELEQARQMLEEYGPRKAKEILGKAVRRMKEQWPEAKTFGAIQKYVPDAARDFDREEYRRQQEQDEQLLRKREKEEQTRQEAERIKFIATWRPVWDELPEEEREAIRGAVLCGPKRHLKSVPTLAEKLCLIEMARRKGAAIPCEIEAL